MNAKWQQQVGMRGHVQWLRGRVCFVLLVVNALAVVGAQHKYCAKGKSE